MMILAELLDRFSPGAIGWTVLGVLGFLGAYILVLLAIKVTRETFGKKPPMSSVLREIYGKLEELKQNIEKEMKLLVVDKDLDEYKEEQRLRCVGLEKQISDARHSFDERANSDLRRTLETLKEITDRGEKRDLLFSGFSRHLAKIEERTETHLRKLDQYDSKFDNLLRDVSAATARGVRSAQH